MSENVNDSLRDSAETSAKSAKVAAEAAKKIKKGKTLSKGAALATKAISGKALVIVVGVVLVFVVLISLVNATPSVVWNSLFHVDPSINPVKSSKIERSLNADSMIKEEEEWAALVSSYLTDSHEAAYDRIRQKCKKDGVDFDATSANIIDSYDFLGSDLAKSQGVQYQNEQTIYDTLKSKGYSRNSALAILSSMSYLTGVKVDYGFDSEDGGGTTSKNEDSNTEVGAFKFSKASFSKWVMKTYPETKNNPTAVKNQMLIASVQADYFDYLMKESLSKKNLTTFKKSKNTKTSIKTLCVNFSQLGKAENKKKEKDIYNASEVFSSKHLIGNLGDDSSGNKNTAQTDSASSDKKENANSRTKQILGKIKSRKDYPKSISSNKKAAEAAYKKNKKNIDSAYRALISAKLSPSAAAGILGNAWQESHWNTTVISGDGYGSQGIIQWTGGRKSKMKSWIKSNGGNWKDITWQAKFAAYEIRQGSESKSFSSYKRNVTSYVGDSFFRTKALGSYSNFASSDDPIATTVNYCACIERCLISASNMKNRYAGTEVILEQCGGIKADASGDPNNTGAGSRQMATILAALSVKEDQLFSIPAKIENIEKDMKTGSKIFGLTGSIIDVLDHALGNNGNVSDYERELAKKEVKPSDADYVQVMKAKSKVRTAERIKNGESYKKDASKLGSRVGAVVGGWIEIQRHPDPKADLKKYMEGKNDILYDVVYGDIVTNDDGKKVYASVEIRPATTDTISRSVFGLDPDAMYQTEDGIPIADKSVTNEMAITTMTDCHMEMLYGNHDYGSGNSTEFATLGGGALGMPLKFSSKNITSPFGYRMCPFHGREFHNGIDIAKPTGTPIYAAADGTVSLAGVYGGYGNCVIIKHGGGMTTLYGHQSKLACRKGQTVRRGQLIGYVGSTGNSTGPHLHFTVTVNGKDVNPMPLLKKSSS